VASAAGTSLHLGRPCSAASRSSSPEPQYCAPPRSWLAFAARPGAPCFPLRWPLRQNEGGAPHAASGMPSSRACDSRTVMGLSPWHCRGQGAQGRGSGQGTRTGAQAQKERRSRGPAPAPPQIPRAQGARCAAGRPSSAGCADAGLAEAGGLASSSLGSASRGAGLGASRRTRERRTRSPAESTVASMRKKARASPRLAHAGSTACRCSRNSCSAHPRGPPTLHPPPSPKALCPGAPEGVLREGREQGQARERARAEEQERREREQEDPERQAALAAARPPRQHPPHAPASRGSAAEPRRRGARRPAPLRRSRRQDLRGPGIGPPLRAQGPRCQRGAGGHGQAGAGSNGADGMKGARWPAPDRQGRCELAEPGAGGLAPGGGPGCTGLHAQRAPTVQSGRRALVAQGHLTPLIRGVK